MKQELFETHYQDKWQAFEASWIKYFGPLSSSYRMGARNSSIFIISLNFLRGGGHGSPDFLRF